MPTTRHLLPRLSMVLLPAAAVLMASLAAQAQTGVQSDVEAATAAALREQSSLRVELTQTAVMPSSAATPKAPAMPVAGQPAAFDAATQTTVWAGVGRAAIGLGVQQPWRAPTWAAPAAAEPQRDGHLLLALSLKTSGNSRVVWQSEPLGATPADGGIAAPARTLDLRRSDPYRSLLRGSLRMQLGRDTALTLKQRGRRLGVVLSSQW